MMNPVMNMPRTWGTIGSTLLTVIFFWDMLRRYCPPELRRYLEKCSIRVSQFFNPYVQISIHEYLGSHLRPHEAYSIVEAYLSLNSSKHAKRLKAEMTKDNDSKLMLSMDEYERTTDEFNGVQVKWISGKAATPPRPMSFSYYLEPEKRYYKLKFHKQYKEMITETYLEHVIKKGKEIQARNRQRKLYTNGHSKSYWSHIVFEHPAKFQTLAMEKEKKEEIVEDLLTFTKSKDFYARIGKAWKRGYLLYGPPGTGKSTMIAAMANLLDYDVYDLELTSVKDNTELRRLLTETTAKSIIVIEDIDCSLDLTGQRTKRKEKSETESGKKEGSRKEKEESGSKVTLSGLLNFIDGLWSACAGERLIVFTTNYVDKLDPALTRRGRMDKHIELSYCKYEGFKVLAYNYLELEAHPLFQSVAELIKEVDITPADVAENLMPKSAKEGPEECLLNLIHTLEEAKGRQITKCTEELKDKEPNHDTAAPPEKPEI
ncbi:UNVERIFIED_CONTAM: AAA-ATPase ASD, mitochondrial [Sesamum latifolium]|uniref:AAA-ATPase ASD, mitochondrial n=1 Tax=Sesamum latifolium TaxID=2727402 RepID=A0AAW2UYY4_9LAMI